MRKYRELDNATKARISGALRGRTMTQSHKDAISRAMLRYWATIPYKDEDNEADDEGEGKEPRKEN